MSSFKKLLTLLVTALAFGLISLVVAPAALAAPEVPDSLSQESSVGVLPGITVSAGLSTTKASSSKPRVLPKAARALNAAETRRGSRYVWGGSGPKVFDCSGLTRWAYARVGETLPHSSSAQVKRTARTRHPHLGDLVFFYGPSGVYHVGLWAGPGQVFEASQSGVPVRKNPIWSKQIFFGHVR